MSAERDLWSPEQKARMLCNLGDMPLIAEDEAARDEEICEDISAVFAHHGEVNIKYAVLTVIDDGDPTIEGKPWALFHAFEDIANDARLRFVDAVIKNLRG